MWQSAVPVITQIINAESTKELISILDKESKRKTHAEPIQIGCRIAKDIIEAGAETIYAPETWVVELIWDPRQLMGEASAAASKVKNKANDIGADDAIGAIAGAIAGAVKGAVGGGRAGAVKGAAEGAITGGVSNSVKSGMT